MYMCHMRYVRVVGFVYFVRMGVLLCVRRCSAQGWVYGCVCKYVVFGHELLSLKP